jgi:hypothetical protein
VQRASPHVYGNTLESRVAAMGVVISALLLLMTRPVTATRPTIMEMTKTKQALFMPNLPILFPFSLLRSIAATAVKSLTRKLLTATAEMPRLLKSFPPSNKRAILLRKKKKPRSYDLIDTIISNWGNT